MPKANFCLTEQAVRGHCDLAANPSLRASFRNKSIPGKLFSSASIERLEVLDNPYLKWWNDISEGSALAA
jgi:hypothetical protein